MGPLTPALRVGSRVGDTMLVKVPGTWSISQQRTLSFASYRKAVYDLDRKLRSDADSNS